MSGGREGLSPVVWVLGVAAALGLFLIYIAQPQPAQGGRPTCRSQTDYMNPGDHCRIIDQNHEDAGSFTYEEDVARRSIPTPWNTTLAIQGAALFAITSLIGVLVLARDRAD
jgi:hypothetical protein